MGFTLTITISPTCFATAAHTNGGMLGWITHLKSMVMVIMVMVTVMIITELKFVKKDAFIIADL